MSVRSFSVRAAALVLFLLAMVVPTTALARRTGR